ncbi:hypothetical protein [Psychrobacter sp. 16-MNA-CIBAN-0192]|uniref:hypothetical protein n=1 Tax=Psychrobacter sp. 16-MNA-CIBAN-0192 TaxID=3140448 RepID=UPI003332F210
MDEESKKEYKLPSMLEMNEVFDKFKSQTNPLSYHLEKSNSLLGIASQYEHLNSAVSIGEIARKAFQQSDLVSNNLVTSSVLASHVQLKSQEVTALQDNFLHITGGLSANNNVMLAAESTMKGMGRDNAYKDAMASFSRFRKSLEPLRDALNTAGKTFNGSEFSNLVRELQTSRIIPESTLSEYAGIVKQFDSLRNLESFKAISRLENFPNDKLWTQDYDKKHGITEDFLAEVKKIDERISDEVSSVDDFNDLSENSQRSLEKLSLSYYQVFIINYIYIITILKDKISNSLKYSNMEFRFVGLSSKVLVGACFINFQPDFNSICNSILASILLESIKQDEKK